MEKHIERKVCEYAAKNGFLVLKLNVVSDRGWPDRVLIDPDGWHVYIEFKAPGKQPSQLQVHRRNQLLERQVLVFTCDNVEEGKEFVDELVAARVSREGDKETGESGKPRVIPGPWTRED